MWAEDDASKGLGMEIVEIGPGLATLAMTVRPTWSTASASPMAASSSRSPIPPSPLPAIATMSVSWRHRPDHLHQAGKLGDRSLQGAREISRSGRSAFTTCVSPGDTVIAEFRGHSRVIPGTWLPTQD
jgi:acyl-CoA thioesterase